MKTLNCAVGALLALISASDASAADLGGSYKDGAGGVFETPVSGASVNWSGFYLGGGVGRNSTTHDIQGQRSESSAKALTDVYEYVDEAGKPVLTNDNTCGGAKDCRQVAKAGDSVPFGADGDAVLKDYPSLAGYTFDSASVFSSDGSAKGFTGSLGLGYDKQLGSMLVGVMGDYQFRGAKSTFGDASIAQSDAIFLGARIGYLPTNKMLLYVLGGYTWLGHDSFAANLRAADDARGCNTSDKKGCSATYGDGNFGGFTVGGGAEVAVTHTLFLGLESRYTMYGKETIKTYTANDNIQHQIETISMTDEPSEWYVGATLKLKMNGDGFASLK